MEIELPVEFIVTGTPVSLQASSDSRRLWKDRVEAAARKMRQPESFLVTRPLAVLVHVFFDAPTSGDLDNLLKPILDALEGVIYTDDNLIADLHIKKSERNGNGI